MMNNKINFFDLSLQYKSIKEEINFEILETLESSCYVLGEKVKNFEDKFSEKHNSKFGIAFNSGTSALHLALLAIGVKEGDEVLIPSMTFIATAAAVAYIKAIPVFVDIDLKDLNINVAEIESKITSKTKAIIPVHLHGNPANIEKICAIAKKHSIKVIEDCAQAHLSTYKDRPVGSFGDIGCFSFYPAKNLGAYGEGGIAITNSNEYARVMNSLRDWGQEKKYHHECLGYNYRMDAIQGAVLSVKFKYLNDWTDLRIEKANLYRSLLNLSNCYYIPPVNKDSKHVYHIFSIFHPYRDELASFLRQNNIFTGMHYPIPLHLQNAFSDLKYKKGDFPCSEKFAHQQLSLPLYPEIKNEDIQRVASLINQFSIKKKST